MLSNAKFEAYYQLLIKRNKEFNLTTIINREDVWVKHFADSLAALPYLPSGASLIDIGSGAGFPALPLKIVREDISVTMVESVGKKANFLKEAIDVLGLGRAEVINKRAEDLDKKILYDVGTARAVAKMVTLCEYILPFVRVGGVMLAFKAKDAGLEAEEAKRAISTLGGQLERIEKIELGELERNLIIIRKIAPTPPKYPRGGNKPRLSPIL